MQKDHVITHVKDPAVDVDLGGVWKQQSNPACTKGVSVQGVGVGRYKSEEEAMSTFIPISPQMVWECMCAWHVCVHVWVCACVSVCVRECERKKVSWCFTPSQPVRLYQGDKRERQTDRQTETETERQREYACVCLCVDGRNLSMHYAGIYPHIS